jgi:hypothetical protein
MTEGMKPSDRDVSSVRLAASERVSSVDPRAHAAWRTWLAALAHDPDAVTAAALAYESLTPEGRDAWLEALEADASEVGVPEVALFAPLLAVEHELERRLRIAAHVTGAPRKSTPPRAFVGTLAPASAHGSSCVCVIVSSLYLEFVELLTCRYDPDRGVEDAKHDWLVHERRLGELPRELGVELSERPLAVVVEDLAHAVVADRRAGRSAPEELLRFVDLFGLDVAVAPGGAAEGEGEP